MNTRLNNIRLTWYYCVKFVYYTLRVFGITGRSRQYVNFTPYDNTRTVQSLRFRFSRGKGTLISDYKRVVPVRGV